MTKRLDYIRIAPGGARAFGSVYGYVLQSGRPRSPSSWFIYVSRKSTIVNTGSRCILVISSGPASRPSRLPWFETGGRRRRLQTLLSVPQWPKTGVPDEAYKAVRVAFSEKELVDLTIAISLMNGYDRLGISFRDAPQATVRK